jgi:hypothetical protein
MGEDVQISAAITTTSIANFSVVAVGVVLVSALLVLVSERSVVMLRILWLHRRRHRTTLNFKVFQCERDAQLL